MKSFFVAVSIVSAVASVSATALAEDNAAIVYEATCMMFTETEPGWEGDYLWVSNRYTGLDYNCGFDAEAILVNPKTVSFHNCRRLAIETICHGDSAGSGCPPATGFKLSGGTAFPGQSTYVSCLRPLAARLSPISVAP